ncbi:MAG: sigma-70 family RNA polymerase sigma factor [Bacilli bacterium]|jgi:RNA polymerase sporulation-specific sigma factor|nr:sigma-70 family RNA polymerase sigma factor [Bacilli bacterium]
MSRNLSYQNLEIITQDEFILYFKQYQNGSKEAREYIIMHYIRYIIKYIHHNWPICYEKDEFEDFVSIAIIGLIKALDTYDLNKNILFLTYANTVISNTLKMYFRKYNRSLKEDSLQKNISTKSTLEDIIPDSFDLLDNYLAKEEIADLYQYLSYLDERDQLILKMYFGFYGKISTQQEIANYLHVTQSYISKKIPKIIKQLQKYFNGYTRKKISNS